MFHVSAHKNVTRPAAQFDAVEPAADKALNLRCPPTAMTAVSAALQAYTQAAAS